VANALRRVDDQTAQRHPHHPALLGNLVDLLNHPSTEEDKELGEMTLKIKGNGAGRTRLA
jgi:hypothetical protein